MLDSFILVTKLSFIQGKEEIGRKIRYVIPKEKIPELMKLVIEIGSQKVVDAIYMEAQRVIMFERILLISLKVERGKDQESPPKIGGTIKK